MSSSRLIHIDPRLGNGYEGICAFCAVLTPLYPWFCVVVYEGRIALFHVEEDSRITLYKYFHDLRDAGMIKGDINITSVRTDNGITDPD